MEAFSVYTTTGHRFSGTFKECVGWAKAYAVGTGGHAFVFRGDHSGPIVGHWMKHPDGGPMFSSVAMEKVL